MALFMPIFKSSTIIAYVLQNKNRNDVQLSLLHSYGLDLCPKNTGKKRKIPPKW